MSAASTITLPPQIGAATIEELRKHVSSAHGVSLEINASELLVVGTQAVQLLLVCAAECKRKGVALVVSGAGDNLRSAFSRLGIATDTLKFAEVK